MVKAVFILAFEKIDELKFTILYFILGNLTYSESVFIIMKIHKILSVFFRMRRLSVKLKINTVLSICLNTFCHAYVVVVVVVASANSRWTFFLSYSLSWFYDMTAIPTGLSNKHKLATIVLCTVINEEK